MVRSARLAHAVTTHPWWVIGLWLLLATAGAIAAPSATAALSYDFGLPGRSGYEANVQIAQRFGSGGDNAPVLMVIGDGERDLPGGAGPAAATVGRIAQEAAPGSRVVTAPEAPDLAAADGRTAVVVVYPRTFGGADPYATALPALTAAAGRAAAGLDRPVTVTGVDALATDGGGGGADVVAETVFGGAGALIVLVAVFGSLLALTPLAVAAASILTTFLVVRGLTEFTDVSFIVQYLLALIGLGVAIDYALLVVTRWREELGPGGADRSEGARSDRTVAAVERALLTAGRSVLFSGVTVAVSLAALIALPVPFLRSIGFTGLLIPVISVAAALTLLPALLVVAGHRLDWPHRRRTDPESALWLRVGRFVVGRRWVAVVLASVALLLLAAPVLGLRLGQPTNDSLASLGGPAGVAVTRLEAAGLGAGLTQPVEVLTSAPDGTDRVLTALRSVPGVAGVVAPARWSAGGSSVVLAWSSADASTPDGSAVTAALRRAGTAAGGRVGGLPAQDADFVSAVYGNAGWVIGAIVVVTFGLLARALRSVVLPLKALLLNVLSLAAAYGVTVLIWQHGFGTELLFDQRAAGSVTTWVPIAVFAFLFGLSMDYEVFLLSRIREEYDRADGHDTDEATVFGVARTGRLVTSAALILFLAFVSLSRVPSTDVKILATGLALGIVIDATIVRGVLAPALVAGLGRANWWLPGRPGRARRR
jgi:putative drug exporter of the RND superfamily